MLDREKERECACINLCVRVCVLRRERKSVHLCPLMCMGECVRERKSVRLCQFERVNMSNGTIVQMQAGGGRMW